MKKYLLNGQEVILICKAGKRFAVQSVYEADDEERIGDEFFADEVFDKPPVEKYFAEIKGLQDKVSELAKERRELQEGVRLETQKHADFLKKAKRLKALSRIEDFIDGKITHYVQEDYSGLSIIEFKDAVSDEDGRASVKPLRLLSLFGKSNGDLEWKLSKYSDNSGCQSEVFPFCSREDALAFCRERFPALFEVTKNHPREYYIKSANNLGIEVPTDYRANVVEANRKGLIERQAKLEAELAGVNQNLTNL